MSCYHPLKAYNIGIPNPKTGKPKLVILPYDKIPDSEETGDWFEIPCGVCEGCRKQQAYDWTQRAVAELVYYNCSCFVTLTYDDRHVPLNCNGAGTLVYNHFQKFMKRLRKAHPHLDLRYFACGEYGSHTMRPHFHAVIYGYDFPDRQFLKFSGKGSMLYTSEELSKLWKDGFVTVGDVTPASCGYVAGYIASKIGKFSRLKYESLDLTPPKIFASKRPALGLRWFEENLDKYYQTDVQFIRTDMGSFKIGLPRYFKKKLEILSPELYAHVKDTNCYKSELIKSSKLLQTDKSYLESLKVQEVNAKAAVHANVRDLKL